jgi:hypothetical protein
LDLLCLICVPTWTHQLYNLKRTRKLYIASMHIHI